MIGYLKGTVLKVLPKTILLEVSGVGYEVFPTGGLLSQSKEGQALETFIHTLVREQELSLYGFTTLDERTFFEKLITISGVGPKLAVQILSQPQGAFLQAVEQGDIDFIIQTPGVGKKMAQKLVVELQGKLDLSSQPSVPSAMSDATEALQGLGYDLSEIKYVLKEAPGDLSSEALIRFFLGQQN